MIVLKLLGVILGVAVIVVIGLIVVAVVAFLENPEQFL